MKTERFQPTGSNLGATLRQSAKMVFGGDVPNYTILFIDPTSKHAAGSHQMFVVPNITFGRSPRCHVSYGDNYKSVSREHASLTVQGSQFYLNHNPNATNPTLVNGQAIGAGHILNNGDEVQFSANGPKIRFNTSTTKTSTIGLTSRLGSAVGQALKPYKTAVAVLGIFLFGSLAFGGYTFLKTQDLEETTEAQSKEIDNQTKVINNQNDVIAELSEDNKKARDRVNNLNKKQKDIIAKNQELEELVNNPPTYVYTKPPASIDASNGAAVGSSSSGATTSSTVSGSSSDGTINFSTLPTDDVYFLIATRLEVAFEGQLYPILPEEGQVALWSGTGFLTNEGKLITARHVLQPWRYFKDDMEENISILESKGARITIIFYAISKTGDSFSFNSNKAEFDDSQDVLFAGSQKRAMESSSDWAYINFQNRKGSTVIDRKASESLSMGEKIYPLGYSYSLNLQPTSGELKPLLSESLVAQDGLTNRVINTSMRGFGPGNSGGPVFKKVNGKFVVVGIVAAGLGSEIGIIVPVSNLQ